jgi:hypothetical protein
MSCKHGNWEPCEECEAEDALYESGRQSVFKQLREKGTAVEASQGMIRHADRLVEALAPFCKKY